jgi:ubiquinone/menaquinone biosynthesis C-methylase UbiE
MTVESVHDEIARSLDVSTATAVLDIGCGGGADLVRIGGLAPESARLVGLDSSRNGIDAARTAAGSDPRFSFLVHDASAGLPFANGEFDRVLSVNLLECIQDKQHLLREVHRVLAPNGRIAFAHWDWDSQLIDGDDKNLVRRIVHTFGDLKQAWMADVDPWMGRRLWRTFQASGLFDGVIQTHVVTSTRFEPGACGTPCSSLCRGLLYRSWLNSWPSTS